MSYISDTSPAQKISFVVGLIALSLVARFVWAGGVEEYFNPAKQVENQIVEVLEERPGDLALLRAMEDYFPLQYDELLEAMTYVAQRDASPDAVSQAGSAQLAQFMANHRTDFALAPQQSLDAVLTAERKLLEALRTEEPVYCADYLFGTLIPTDPLSPESNQLMGEAAAARVQAMAAGRADQQLRMKATPRDIASLSDTMRAEGASDMQIAVLFENGNPATLSSAEQCDSMLQMLRSMEKQPDARRALLTGSLLAW